MIAGLVAYITLTLMGNAFAAPLAAIVGVFDLLPLVGATIAAIIVGIVTLFYSFPTDTIIWLIVQVVYRDAQTTTPSSDAEAIVPRRLIDVRPPVT